MKTPIISFDNRKYANQDLAKLELAKRRFSRDTSKVIFTGFKKKPMDKLELFLERTPNVILYALYIRDVLIFVTFSMFIYLVVIIIVKAIQL